MPVPSLPRSTVILLALALAAVPGRLAAQAQATTGVIRGIVSDSAGGGALAGAVVTLRNAETNAERVLTTNESGVYVATLLRVGTYAVTARALGFQEARKADLILRLGETLDVPFGLVPQAVQLQEVSVTAEPLIDVTSSESATRLGVEAVEGLPNNGRNIFNFTTLTPNVAIVQGPDGDEISVGGQRGIHNNVSVDGADFNNPFFGEQRGGQRPAFTFNLDAVQDFVVVADGANAEFGRSSGGFINVITKSGHQRVPRLGALLRQVRRAVGRLHPHLPGRRQYRVRPRLHAAPVRRHVRRAAGAGQGVLLHRLRPAGVQRDSSRRTGSARSTLRSSPSPTPRSAGRSRASSGRSRGSNDANALLAKLDFRLSQKHSATLKYNYTRSSQQNGTFDVDSWGRSANALEKDHSHAVNGSLTSLLSSALSNEFRFQVAREDRPRPYAGAINPSTGRPFPDTDIGFVGPAGFSGTAWACRSSFRWRPRTTTGSRCSTTCRILRGNHLFKIGAEWNRTGVNQTFLGFGNGRIAFTSVNGFLNYAANGNDVRRVLRRQRATPRARARRARRSRARWRSICSRRAWAGSRSRRPAPDDHAARARAVPPGQLEAPAELDDQLRPPLGGADPAQPDHARSTSCSTRRSSGQTVTNSVGDFEFPGDGTIPSDYSMFQPRLGFA